MNKIVTNLLRLIIPLVFVLFLCFIYNTEIGVFILSVLLITYTFSYKYEEGEALLFVIGLFIGTVFELTGTLALGQKWGQSAFFMIPIWLPLFWGYGFVMMRRFGNLLVKIHS